MTDRLSFKSRQPKPPTGMAMTVTMSMPADQTVDEAAASLIKFFEGIFATSNDLSAVWLSIRCAGIPPELEQKLQTAFDKANKRPTLSVVINNG